MSDWTDYPEESLEELEGEGEETFPEDPPSIEDPLLDFIITHPEVSDRKIAEALRLSRGMVWRTRRKAEAAGLIEKRTPVPKSRPPKPPTPRAERTEAPPWLPDFDADSEDGEEEALEGLEALILVCLLIGLCLFLWLASRRSNLEGLIYPA